MADRYMVSIIIPHYNSPDLLEKLLRTIPDENAIQTIIIDDHSDEAVKTRLKELEALYANRNILFLDNDTSEHNPGVSRNIGLKYAEGKWLLFADADDYFLDEFYTIIRNYFDSDFDIVFFSPMSVQLDTGETSIRNISYTNGVADYLKRPCLSTESYLRYSWHGPWSKLIRTSMVKEHSIAFKSAKCAEDVLFSTKTGFYAKKITASERTIYCVTRNVGSLTTNRNLEFFDMVVREMIQRNHFLRNHLTRKEFRASEPYRVTIWYLLLILQRRYGIRVFFKYFKLFRQNKMPLFGVRMFFPTNFVRWLRSRRVENEIKKGMSSKDGRNLFKE